MWSIRKWYLDCVAGDGTAWIGYWGDVRWGALHVSFASSLLFDGARAETKTSLHREVEPQHDAHRIAWDAPSVGVSFELTPRTTGVEKELYDSVHWRCVAPSGDVVVQLPGRTIRGRGYAEVLEMGVAPWRLPIRELRWGRAIGAQTSLVWIQWRGAFPLQVVVRDGVLEDAAHIDDDEVRLADGTRLAMFEKRALREESLANTLAPLKWVLPKKLTGAFEEKWLSRGTISFIDRPIDEGWVIHERVLFPGE